MADGSVLHLVPCTINSPANKTSSLASAVAIPEQETALPSPDAPPKRRNSSLTDAPSPDSKRRRLSTHDDHPPQPAHSPDRPPANADADADTDRRSRPAGRREEDRKRGRRLFGALLGTLSQSSSSAAQKRRADIERRQQDKLKLQDEEYDELKRKRREERAVVRRREQRVYEAEAVCLRFTCAARLTTDADGVDAHAACESAGDGPLSEDAGGAGISMCWCCFWAGVVC